MKKWTHLLVSFALLTAPVWSRTRQEIEAQYAREMKQATTGSARAAALRGWGVGAKAAGVPAAELQRIWVERVQELMRSDFYAAYEAILDSDFLAVEPTQVFGLFPAQQEALRRLAQYTVENYSATPKLPYPADIPMPGHAWGDLSRNSVAASSVPGPSASPTPAAWQPRWAPGQFFADSNDQPWAVLLKIDPVKKRYGILTRTWYPKAEPYYLTAEEWGHYILAERWVEEPFLAKARPANAKYRACGQCGGEACQYVEGGRARGGEWEQVSSTLKVYSPRRVPISYTKVVCCGGCAGTGWIKL